MKMEDVHFLVKRIYDKLNLDEIDQRIIQLLQQNPDFTHSEIGEVINRSQPAVGIRVRKLQQAGILEHKSLLNYKSANLIYGKIEFTTKKPKEILQLVRKCPFMLNGFQTVGNKNMMVLLVGTTYGMLYKIIDFHFRNGTNIKDLNFEIISEIAKNLILPIEDGKCECSLNLKKI
jgi:DNA-binding Lrp family transcriptional regulator